ncbi:NAD(P)-dependent oxidoreductase [Oxalicibacterium faecigallinarum]|uniref:3-beta hydroxysteroid dehydrogenase n=1 Tax=Oxalicibacterium faecigallinarum TaxID=573741 RepID=A0A8J3ALH3_9BURK|nr:NAD(P)-dependent oxidoreductase [Oxalicibacterium faecigallinarum]GGI16827.1 3-beta hydroxysteroid dehydrogenase [Oxalicibacterium faecigallinarum]
MSKIAIIGATGRAGSRLLEEALRRGHSVTAIARKASAAPARNGVTAIDVDVQDTAALQKALSGHEAVFSAAHFSTIAYNKIVTAVRNAGVPRLLVVGGAGSLFVAPGLRVIDTPDFPPEYKAEASAGFAYLNALQDEKDIDWTFLSPSAEFVEGPRTGIFRIGKDDLLVDAAGRSWITFADYAIAYLDELEKPVHSRQRFTVGY